MDLRCYFKGFDINEYNLLTLYLLRLIVNWNYKYKKV